MGFEAPEVEISSNAGEPSDIRNITGSVTLPTGASTAARQDTGNNSLNSIDTKTPPLVSGRVPVDNNLAPNASTLTEQQTQSARIGDLTETAPATDTASSGLNGRLQRIAQRLSSILSFFENLITSTGNRLNVNVKFDKNSIATDSAGVLRTTSIKQIFGYSFSQTLHPLTMRNKLDNGGTLTLETSTASAVLTATPTAGSRSQFESKFIVRYTPGRSHLVSISATPGAGLLGYGTRWGFYSDTNGYFFEHLDGETQLRVGLRSNAAGVTGFSIPQSSWNLDKCDGTGPSGFNLNRNNSAVFIIEYTWHGNGTIRWGIQYKKDIVYVHEVEADNQNVDVLTRNPSQPVKFECFRTGNGSPVANYAFKIHALSANVFYQGIIEPTYRFSTSMGVTSKTIGNAAYSPLISIRAGLLFNGRINRSLLVPKSARFYSASSPLHIRVKIDAVLTGAVWTSVGNESSAERDVSATAATGGTIVYEDYIKSTEVDDFIFGRFQSPEAENLVLGLSVDGTVADTITIEARSLTNNSVSYASIYWGEYQT